VEDGVRWGGDGEDKDFPYPLGDFPPTTHLDWDSMGEPIEGLDVTLEATPRNVKGRREFLNLECFIICDAKGAFTRQGKGKSLVF
jgi:hypothetical protein